MSDDTRDTLKDVDHTPPNGEPVSAVWERGMEPDATADAAAEAPADD